MAVGDEKYAEAVKGMRRKARFKLANYMAHGFEIDQVSELTVICREGTYIAIDKAGNLWRMQKAI